MADISPRILSGINPYHFLLLYKASRELIFLLYFTNLQVLQRILAPKLMKYSKFLSLRNFYTKKFAKIRISTPTIVSFCLSKLSFPSRLISSVHFSIS